jgi:hypothetical protein
MCYRHQDAGGSRSVRRVLGIGYLIAFCLESIISTLAIAVPALQIVGEVSTLSLLALSLLVFLLALIGVLTPRIVFILPSLLYFAFTVFFTAFWIILPAIVNTGTIPEETTLRYLGQVFPWFGPLNVACQGVQFLTGSVCLIYYVRSSIRSPAAGR